ncbi:hypothetical protein JYQ62_35335 [Nostoc sp. UHCC 0702]|nr:hypothetical protein JYQ62_35335 [Nostoc sp. UHCC 0702]
MTRSVTVGSSRLIPFHSITDTNPSVETFRRNVSTATLQRQPRGCRETARARWLPLLPICINIKVKHPLSNETRNQGFEQECSKAGEFLSKKAGGKEESSEFIVLNCVCGQPEYSFS